ncbi:Ras-like protein Rab-11A [Phytophthora palmivora]|uniref:Ras-like protein Rab-11A n=1 Tax=Phytophthora palmivora TaxID=4796 RepID=A0A2P4YJ37_9STRA|nr:Ras-like protein Rab-11A [Phytophthora palmivora]
METTHKSTTVLRCKVAIVGDATVGKTALVQVLKSNGHEYPKNYVMTSDVELSTKSIPIPDSSVVVELYLFDCAGQSIFNQLDFGTVHYKGASMALVVFDVNNKESFKSCSKWYQDVRDASPNHNIPGVLLANKTDLRYNNRDAISTKEAEEFAERNDLKYFECSAVSIAIYYDKNGSNNFAIRSNKTRV